MNTKKFRATLAGTLLVATTAGAANFIYTLRGDASLTVTQSAEGKHIHKVETRFFDNAYKGVLFKVTTTSVTRVGAEGSTTSSVVENYKSDKRDFDTLAYTVSEKGGDFAWYSDELFSLTEYGCCDSPTIHRLMKISTGEKVEATLNKTAIDISVPNTKLPHRYLAQVLDSRAPRKKDGKTYIGTISYFEANMIISRARVYANLPDGWGTEMELEVVARANDEVQADDRVVVLFGSDGDGNAATAFSGFGFRGRIRYDKRDEWFTISVNNDRIDATQSTKSSDLDIEFVY